MSDMQERFRKGCKDSLEIGKGNKSEMSEHRIDCPEPPRLPKPRRQGGDYRPHYPARQADAYMDCIEDELLSAQSRIRELEQHNSALIGEDFSDRNHHALRSRVQKSEAERDQLKAEIETALQQRDAAMIGQTERQHQFEKMGDLADEAIEQRNTAEAKLSRILAITEDTKWFDTPCARAVREVLEGK